MNARELADEMDREPYRLTDVVRRDLIIRALREMAEREEGKYHIIENRGPLEIECDPEEAKGETPEIDALKARLADVIEYYSKIHYQYADTIAEKINIRASSACRSAIDAIESLERRLREAEENLEEVEAALSSAIRTKEK
jgi:hypothetical protein